MRMALAVGLGGALGALCRYGLGLLLAPGRIAALSAGLTPLAAFPLATLVANVLGCLGIGILAAYLDGRAGSAPELVQAFAVVGLLGGLTTFSSYELDLFSLLREGRAGLALGYGIGSLILGFLALRLGWSLGGAIGP